MADSMPTQLTSLLVTMTFVIVVAKALGWLFRKAGQPAVLGEMLGGIALGPSVLGLLFPTTSQILFHADVLRLMGYMAEIGVALFLFVVGLEVDLARLGRSTRPALMISQMSIVIPFVLGLVLGFQIFEKHAPEGIGIFEFSIFIGVALSITAFPVLARILRESSLHQTRIAELALVCAAIDDITAWCLLAVVTGLLGASWGGVGFTLVMTGTFILLMLLLVRPLVEKYGVRWRGPLPMAATLAGALLCAAITDWIGIHSFFGAFLFGVLVPHDWPAMRTLSDRLSAILTILFLPAFFALTGLKTELSLLGSPDDWLFCILITATAIVGKFGGTFLGAKIAGESHRDATLLGVLMNTRGLVELIALNIGLKIGVITPTLFTMLVLMA